MRVITRVVKCSSRIINFPEKLKITKVLLHKVGDAHSLKSRLISTLTGFSKMYAKI